MTKAQIRQIVAGIIGVPEREVSVWNDSTVVDCSMDVSYEQMLKLAAALGTTKINFRTTEGEPGYSEYTPGCDSSFELTIGIGAPA